MNVGCDTLNQNVPIFNPLGLHAVAVAGLVLPEP